MLEKARQMSYINIAILVERGREHRASVFAEEAFHICSAAEKRHTEGCLCDYHKDILSYCLEEVSVTGFFSRHDSTNICY